MRTLSLAVLIASAAACSHGQGRTNWAGEHRYAPVGFATGVEAAVLQGNLGQSELYAIRVTIGPNGTMPPHTHPDTRQMTVLEGEVWYGFGETLNLEEAPLYRAGDFFVVHGGQPHYARAGSDGVTYQEAGMGPTATTPLD